MYIRYLKGPIISKSLDYLKKKNKGLFKYPESFLRKDEAKNPLYCKELRSA